MGSLLTRMGKGSVTRMSESMAEVRDDLNIGLVRSLPKRVKGMDAKFRIAELLDIDINCVKRFKDRVGKKI